MRYRIVNLGQGLLENAGQAATQAIERATQGSPEVQQSLQNQIDQVQSQLGPLEQSLKEWEAYENQLEVDGADTESIREAQGTVNDLTNEVTPLRNQLAFLKKQLAKSRAVTAPPPPAATPYPPPPQNPYSWNRFQVPISPLAQAYGNYSPFAGMPSGPFLFGGGGSIPFSGT